MDAKENGALGASSSTYLAAMSMFCVALALGGKDDRPACVERERKQKAFLPSTPPESRPPSPNVRTNYASSHRGRPVLSGVGKACLKIEGRELRGCFH